MATLAPLSRRPGDRPERWRDAGAGRLGERLRRRLVAAGPLAARLGRQLGTRVDLLAGTDCLALLAIPDRAPPSRPARVAHLLERQLGAGPGALFERFEAEPFASRLASQWHRARLRHGGEVLVELVHPELVEELEGGGLRRLAARLVAAGELPPAGLSAVDEVERRLDLRAVATALEELAEDVAESPWLEVPRAHLRLCAPRVRVLERPTEPAVGEADRPAPETTARRLARSWLSLALDGRLFPGEPWGGALSYLPGGQVAVLGGGVHRLPRALQPELREYLAAVAARKPARAALAFLDLLPVDAASRRLRDRLRHTDPFRDRGWDVGGDLFARQVLAHWQTARDLGHPPPAALAPFYRGLFLLNRELGRLAPDATPVRDGLREARLLLLFGELRDAAGSGRWAGAVERQLALLGELPQRLDRILTLAEEDEGAEAARRRRRGDGRAQRPGAWGAVAAGLVAIAAVVLLTHHVAEAGSLGPWPERLGALLTLGVGGLLLRLVGRDGG